MSQNSDAFDELLSAQAEYLGRTEMLLLNGVSVDFLVGDTNTVDSFVGGGIAQDGSFVGQVRARDWQASGADKFSPFIFRGSALVVTNFQRINDTVKVTASDPTANEV